jgi:hypothetical protein
MEDVWSGNARDHNSDHYFHMEHLSIEAGVAVDRFKHVDEAYQETVSLPAWLHLTMKPRIRRPPLVANGQTHRERGTLSP